MESASADDGSGRSVQSVVTACSIIEGLRELEEASVTELADHTGISKSVVYNHLATLCETGFVVKSDTTYRLGLRFLNIGEELRATDPLYEAAKPQVESLAEETGEFAHLMVEERGWGYYLHRARGDQAVATSSRVGKQDYLHRTGAGKAILANLPEGRVDEILSRRGLPAKTDSTITDRAELLDELDGVREAGVAISDEECVKGARSVGAPIIGPSSEVLGAVSVSGPTTRLRDERLHGEVADEVVKTANYIEVTLSTNDHR